MACRKQRGWLVPGCGLSLRWPEIQKSSVAYQPVAFWDADPLLLSSFDAAENPSFCYTVRERTMIAWINDLTDVPDWERRIFNPDFELEWKNGKTLVGGTARMINWVNHGPRSRWDWVTKRRQCAEEVKYYVHDFVSTRMIPAINGGVIKSDDCIDGAMGRDLRKAAAALRKEFIASNCSTEQVVEVVGPFLLAFALSRTHGR